MIFKTVSRITILIKGIGLNFYTKQFTHKFIYRYRQIYIRYLRKEHKSGNA